MNLPQNNVNYKNFDMKKKYFWLCINNKLHFYFSFIFIEWSIKFHKLYELSIEIDKKLIYLKIYKYSI